MVELRPATVKLNKTENCPSAEELENVLLSVRFRIVDLIASEKSWVNNENTLVFELKQPSVCQLVELVRAIGNVRPNHVDYMYASGDYCIVYMLKWE